MSIASAPALLDPSLFEDVPCYACGSRSAEELVTAEDDLTGKPGRFRFVTCRGCGLAYQSPRIIRERIQEYYDDEYIAHRKKTDWGIMTPLYNFAMAGHDRRKAKIVRNYVSLGRDSQVLDVGCAAGTFLLKIRALYGSTITGVDFKDLSSSPGFDQIEFHCGFFHKQKVGTERFDLITMWHFLEHDYEPSLTLEKGRAALKESGRLIIEVPRLDSVTFSLYRERWPGLQAPQHTVLYSKETLLSFMVKARLEVVDYLPYGAFPAYFYLFAGAAFKRLKGKGLNLSKAIYPYFSGQLLLSPLLLFERQLNLAMQTVICRRG